ncbi:histone-lysine N-methyltransferase NSD2-like isoform X2 [Palaemon carinicauda]
MDCDAPPPNQTGRLGGYSSSVSHHSSSAGYTDDSLPEGPTDGKIPDQPLDYNNLMLPSSISGSYNNIPQNTELPQCVMSSEDQETPEHDSGQDSDVSDMEKPTGLEWSPSEDDEVEGTDDGDVEDGDDLDEEVEDKDIGIVSKSQRQLIDNTKALEKNIGGWQSLQSGNEDIDMSESDSESAVNADQCSSASESESNDEDPSVSNSQEIMINTDALLDGKSIKALTPDSVLCFDEYGNLTTYRPELVLSSSAPPSQPLQSVSLSSNLPPSPPVQQPVPKLDLYKITNQEFLEAAETLESEMSDSVSSSQKCDKKEVINGLHTEAKPIKNRQPKVLETSDVGIVSDHELKQAFKEEFLTAATSRYGRTRKRKTEDGFFFGTINFNELRKITSTTSPKKCKSVTGSLKTTSPEQKAKLCKSESKGKNKLDEVMSDIIHNGNLNCVESIPDKEFQIDVTASRNSQLSAAKGDSDIVQSNLSKFVESVEAMGNIDLKDVQDDKTLAKYENKTHYKAKASHKKEVKADVLIGKIGKCDKAEEQQHQLQLKASLEDDVEKIKQAEKRRRLSIPRRNELSLLRANEPPVNISSERMLRRRSDVWKIKNSLLPKKPTSKVRPAKNGSVLEKECNETSVLNKLNGAKRDSVDDDSKDDILKKESQITLIDNIEISSKNENPLIVPPVNYVRKLRSMHDTFESGLLSTSKLLNSPAVRKSNDSILAPLNALSTPESSTETSVGSIASTLKNGMSSECSKISMPPSPSKVEEPGSVTKYGRTIRKPQLMDVSAEARRQKIEQIKNKEILNDLPIGVDYSTLEKEHPCEHMVGDLVWVLLKGNPLWPAMISYQPDNGEFTKLHVKQTWQGKLSCIRLYFVQFFNDNSQTYWIAPSSALPFEGYTKLKEYLHDLKTKLRTLKSSQKTHAESMLKTLAHIKKMKNSPSAQKSGRWIVAIEEGEQAMVMDRYERLQKYSLKLDGKELDGRDDSKKNMKRISNRSKADVIKSRKMGRPRKIETKENPVSAGKSNDDVFSTDGEFSGFDDNYSSDENRNVSNLIKDISGPKQSFAQYAAKHLQKFILENPNISETAARTKLRWRWKKLANSQAAKRKAKISLKCENKVLSVPVSNSLKRKHDNIEKELLLDSVVDIVAKRKRGEESRDNLKGVYKVVRNEKVCYRCEGLSTENGADMVRCKGVCYGIFHLSCVGLSFPKSEFKCIECQTGDHQCFICKEVTGVRQRCTVTFCGKFYHEECVQKWPQVSKNRHQEKFVCPRHVCHMCAANADDMNDAVARNPQFTRCLRCPTTYHTGEECIAAGSEEISQNHHICTKHLKLPKNSLHHVNVSWCFCCSKGGSLLLCDQCPAAFHAECMKITAPEGSYVCEDCENGKFPVYGDVVWVKLGLYRWWPGQVLHPRYIPDNIENLPHQQGMFCVHFFGSNDYYWVTRGRAFHYQEGDKGSRAASSKTLEMQFQKAIAEALEAYREQRKRKAQLEAVRSGKGKLKPPPYIRIDSNRPVGNVRLNKLDLGAVNRCECDPFSENPCGSDEKCLNRMLMFECVREVCGAGDKCGNQRFQKRQYANVRSFRTDERGWGLKALEDIKKGEFVIEYVGELIDDEEFHRRIEEMHKVKEENYYFLTIDKDIMIDAGPKGNLARFMNHSCEPNCETQKWTVGGDTRVGLFALCDIPPESELTFNYNLQCVGTEKKKCNCGSSNCSGFIGAKVQKNDTNGPKREKLTKRKRKKKRREVKISEDECYRCGGAGDLILCDVTDCPKSYHLQCLSLDKLPKGKWICPWHHCDECGQRSIRPNRCDYCPNSFCRIHIPGNLQNVPGVGNVCQDHDTEDIETLRGQLDAKASAEMIIYENQSCVDQEPNSSHQSSNLPCEAMSSGTHDGNSSLCVYENSISTLMSESPQEEELVEHISKNISLIAPLRMKENRGRPKKVDRVSEGYENNSSVINVNNDNSCVLPTNSKTCIAKSSLTPKNGVRSRSADILAKALSTV